jgi:hypothetical protein
MKLSPRKECPKTKKDFSSFQAVAFMFLSKSQGMVLILEIVGSNIIQTFLAKIYKDISHFINNSKQFIKKLS